MTVPSATALRTSRRSARSAGSRGAHATSSCTRWLFMRLSGVVLVVLVLGHLLIMNVLDGGVQRINFAFVAGRWAQPVLAGLGPAACCGWPMLHGANGLRTVINDYAERDSTRFWLKDAALHRRRCSSSLLGTLVIFTFDPNIR